jgi:pyruvate dehydrogenase E2 component (dihydrolipoamide acetyltransferase)
VTSPKQFKLPDVGEGLTEAEIVRWLVHPGESVTQNQTICEIETAKALVELPSPFAGVVREVLVGEGATVGVGTPIITVDVAGAGEETVPDDETPTSVLVGYGPRGDTPTRRRPRQAASTSSTGTDSTDVPAAGVRAAGAPATDAPAASVPTAGVLAKPPVRKLAKDLGLDLHGVAGSGPDGTITRSDVEAAAGNGAAATARAVEGGEERIAVHGVRKATAEAMVASALRIPHVTEFVTVDVTAMMRAVERLRELPEFAETKVTPLLLVAKGVLFSLARYPMLNSVWDDATDEIVVKHYVNLGIAAATPRGLLVPNIKAAHELSLPELAGAITELARTARDGRTPVTELRGGTFTITNVGVFGVDTGTPVINPGEAAILAFGAVRQQPWVHRGKVRPRWVTTFALSFDHRIVDGELGSKFLRDIASFCEDPGAALLARL